MRIKVSFRHSRKRTYLPINTNYFLVKLINGLTDDYHRYLNSLIPGNNYRKSFDMYTFSQLIIPEREIVNFKLGILSPEFYWYISSPYYQFLGIVAKELREQRVVQICNNFFEVTKVQFINAPKFEKSEAQFTCLSPVAVYRQSFQDRHWSTYQFNGGYILPNDKNYFSFLEKDLVYKYNLLNEQPREHIKFELEFDKRYLRKKHNKITKVITLNGKDTPGTDQVRGVLAPLKIKAEPEVLQVIYDAGLGQLNNLGFGMVETVTSR